MEGLFALLTIILAVLFFRQKSQVKSATTKQQEASEEAEALRKKYQPIEDLNAEMARVTLELDDATEKKERFASEIDTLEAQIAEIREVFRKLDEEDNLLAHGLYNARYEFETSDLYKEKLKEIRDRQKQMVKDGTAGICTSSWTVGGSEAKGKKMIGETIKLAMRAFNGESDAAIAKVNYKNFGSMESKIRRSFDRANKIIGAQNCHITEEYLELKIEELALAFEYQERLQKEKEEQRQIREQMREEQKALREVEKAQKAAEQEEAVFEDALARARKEAESAVGEKQAELQHQIEELNQ